MFLYHNCRLGIFKPNPVKKIWWTPPSKKWGYFHVKTEDTEQGEICSLRPCWRIAAVILLERSSRLKWRILWYHHGGLWFISAIFGEEEDKDGMQKEQKDPQFLTLLKNFRGHLLLKGYSAPKRTHTGRAIIVVMCKGVYRRGRPLTLKKCLFWNSSCSAHSHIVECDETCVHPYWPKSK